LEQEFKVLPKNRVDSAWLIPRLSMPPRTLEFRSMLVISEVALSLALLIGAGLMLKSFVRLQRVDLGFRAQNLLTLWTVVSEAKSVPLQPAGFYQQAWERIQSLPGVKAVGAIDNLPLSGIHGGGPFTVQGHKQVFHVHIPDPQR